MQDYNEQPLSQGEFQRAVLEWLTKIFELIKEHYNPHENEGWMDTAELRREKNISRSTIYNWLESKALIEKKVGGRKYYRTAAFNQKKENQAQEEIITGHFYTFLDTFGLGMSRYMPFLCTRKLTDMRMELPLIGLSLFSRPSKTGWMAGIRIIFRANRSLNKAMQQRKRNARPDLHRLTRVEKMKLGYEVCNAIKAHPVVFVCPVPSMRVLQTATDAFYDAHYYYTRVSRDPYHLNSMIEKEDAFVAVFQSVMQYVDGVAKGKDGVYEKAGILQSYELWVMSWKP